MKDRPWLLTFGCIHAGTWSEILADDLLVVLPCRTIHDIDSEISQSTNSILIINEGSFVEIDARCKSDELVHLICEVVMLQLCEAEEHLGVSH